jgi:hypothetical protein
MSMSLFVSTRTANGAAIAVALSLGFVGETAQTAAQEIPTLPTTEQMRWWDDRMGRTTLMAFFDGPADGTCFNLAGVLTRRDDRVELLYPRVIASAIRHGSRYVPGILLFEDERCRLRVHFTQEVPDGDGWIALPPQRSPGMVSFGAILTNEEGQELPRIPGLHIIPGTHGKQTRMTFGLIESDEGNGLVSRTVLLPKSPQASCPHWTALFTIVPAGATLAFQNARAELPFSATREASPEGQSVSFIFGTATCRLTIKVEKEVLNDGAWTRLNPEPIEK